MPTPDAPTPEELAKQMDEGAFAPEIQELMNTIEGRAGRLAVCILASLPTPQVIITVAVEMQAAKIMAVSLHEDRKTDRFPRRLERALAWAMRDDISPESAIMFGQYLAESFGKLTKYRKTDAFVAYQEKFKDFL